MAKDSREVGMEGPKLTGQVQNDLILTRLAGESLADQSPAAQIVGVDIGDYSHPERLVFDAVGLVKLVGNHLTHPTSNI